MKQLLCALAVSIFSYNATAQIIIMAPPPVIPNMLDSSTLPLSMGSLPSMSPSSGGSWDLDSISIQAAVHTSTYKPATRSFSVASFADSVTYPFSSAAGIGYKTWKNFQQTTSGVAIIGEELLSRQSFGLGTVTGNMLDSMTFPIQAANYSSPLPVMQYPARLGSSWSATTRCTLFFNITVAAASLNNTSAEQRRTRRVLDSIVGWGRMSVPRVGGGGSAWINVLQIQHTEIVLDSFFITSAAGPMPAPASLLTPMGLTQGQTTTYLHTNFYRAGTFRPLATAIHSGSSFSSAPSEFYMDAKNLPAPLTVRTRTAVANIRVYPNPVQNGRLFVDLGGNQKTGWSYTLTNITGQLLAKAPIAVTDASVATIALPEGMSSGIYYLTLVDAERQTTVLPVAID
jgi:hypothetical protein